jgi:lipopolysaccharide biosynthesis regulator YciM
MSETGLFTLIVIAIAAGWVLGRYGRNLWRPSTAKSSAAKSAVNSASFYRGLDFLANEESGEAVEVFIQSLDINPETLELHLALGNLLRRKGEVDRAIRVHQNLLAKPAPNIDSRYIQLELARDFVAAGLLDRAEQTLLELVAAGGDLRIRAAGLLVEIYQSEREWDKAIDAGTWLVPADTRKRRRSLADETRISLAHFHCEIAEQALQQKNMTKVRLHLRQALRADRHCVRASLLEGRMWLAQQQPRRAIRAVRKVEFQRADMLPETIPLLIDAFAQLDDRRALAELLQRWVDKYPRSSLVLALTAEREKEQGDIAAAKLLAEQLKTRPSLRGLNQLIEYHLQHADGRAQENLGLLKTLISTLVVSKPVYQCDHCGFSGQQLHWLCPGCKKWGHIKPIAGVEGE